MRVPNGDPEHRRQQDIARQHRHENPRQETAEHKHHDGDAHQQKSITDNVDEGLAVHVRKSFDVIGHARGQAARRCPIEEAEGQAFHMLEQLHPDVIDDALPDDLEQDTVNVGDHECGKDDRKKQQGQQPDARHVGRTQPHALTGNKPGQRRRIHHIRPWGKHRLGSCEHKGLCSICIQVEMTDAELARLGWHPNIQRHFGRLDACSSQVQSPGEFDLVVVPCPVQHEAICGSDGRIGFLHIAWCIHAHEPGRRRVDVTIDRPAHDQRQGDRLDRQHADKHERNEQQHPVWPRKLEQACHQRRVERPLLDFFVVDASHYSVSTLCSTSCLR